MSRPGLIRDSFERIRMSAPAGALIQGVFASRAMRARTPQQLWRRMPIWGTFTVPVDGTGRQILYDGRGDYLGKVLFWRGPAGFEPGTAELFSTLARQTSGLFFDVGTYSAYYTMLCLTVQPTMKAHCFEPMPSLRAWVATHLDLNLLWDRVTIVPKAASDSTGTATFHGTGAAYSPGGSLVAGFKPQAAPLLEMGTLRLDDYARTLDAPVGLMKIDTEGVELSVLRGARELLKRDRPWVVCEVLGSDASDTRALDQILDEVGYRASQVTPHGLQPLTHIQVDPARTDRNFLLSPKERTLPIALVAPAR